MKQFVVAVITILFVILMLFVSLNRRRITFPANSVQNLVDEKTDRRQDRLSQWKDAVKGESGYRQRRLPDVVGIGVKKCGTGALVGFLGQHPLIKLPEKVETFFFNNNYARGLQHYIRLMPKVAKDELVMEKTPSYFRLAKVVQRIRRDVPNVKLILLLCDPVKRAFSDFVHQHYPSHMNAEPSYFADSFQRLTDIYTSTFTDAQTNLFQAAYVAKRKCSINVRSCLFSFGIYHTEVRNWKNSFNDSQLLILNGDLWLTDPGRLIEDVQEFLQIPKLLIREDFVKSNISGFFCLNRWWSGQLGETISTRDKTKGNGEDLFCLGKGKGRTRNDARTMHSETYDKLTEFYKPHNELLYAILNRNMGW